MKDQEFKVQIERAPDLTAEEARKQVGERSISDHPLYRAVISHINAAIARLEYSCDYHGAITRNVKEKLIIDGFKITESVVMDTEFITKIEW